MYCQIRYQLEIGYYTAVCGGVHMGPTNLGVVVEARVPAAFILLGQGKIFTLKPHTKQQQLVHTSPKKIPVLPAFSQELD